MGEVINCEVNKDGVIVPSNTVTVPQKIHDELVALKENVQKGFLKMGAYLTIIHDNELFIELGSDTWQEYLDTPEIDLSRSQAYKLMQVHSKWIEKWGCDPEEIKKISVEKLYIASSQATDENFSEWLDKAEHLSRTDLKAETSGSVQRPGLTAGQKDEDAFKIVCPHCGKDFYFTG